MSQCLSRPAMIVSAVKVNKNHELRLLKVFGHIHPHPHFVWFAFAKTKDYMPEVQHSMHLFPGAHRVWKYKPQVLDILGGPASMRKSWCLWWNGGREMRIPRGGRMFWQKYEWLDQWREHVAFFSFQMSLLGWVKYIPRHNLPRSLLWVKKYFSEDQIMHNLHLCQ